MGRRISVKGYGKMRKCGGVKKNNIFWSEKKNRLLMKKCCVKMTKRKIVEGNKEENVYFVGFGFIYVI